MNILCTNSIYYNLQPPFTCDIATEPLWDDDLQRYICVECEEGYFSISNDAEPCRACSVCSVFLQSRCSDQCPSVFLGKLAVMINIGQHPVVQKEASARNCN